jgi:hypothetical protein
MQGGLCSALSPKIEEGAQSCNCSTLCQARHGIGLGELPATCSHAAFAACHALRLVVSLFIASGVLSCQGDFTDNQYYCVDRGWLSTSPGRWGGKNATFLPIFLDIASGAMWVVDC